MYGCDNISVCVCEKYLNLFLRQDVTVGVVM